MKIKILAALAAFAVVALLTGCASTGKTVGASAYTDNNVLTGGPTFGTTIKDLPQPVKDTLQQKVPQAEISDITKENISGKTVYKFTFLDKEKYPSMWIAEDGNVVQAQ